MTPSRLKLANFVSEHSTWPEVNLRIKPGRHSIGWSSRIGPPQASPRCIETIQSFRRQALHAERLALSHPATGERLEWRAETPADLAELLAILSEDADRPHA